jgi:hypothetical protein
MGLKVPFQFGGSVAFRLGSVVGCTGLGRGRTNEANSEGDGLLSI